jgi:putative endopeptidase
MINSQYEFNDYYNYINNHWFKIFNLPDEYSRFSTFNIISNKIEEKIIQIIYSISSTDNSYLTPNEILIKNIYTKLTDNHNRNLDSNKPLYQIYNQIDNIKTWDDLSKIIGLLCILDMSVFLNIRVEPDLHSNKNHLLYINELNLLLPSKDYYNNINIQKDYIEYIKKTLNYLKLDIISLPNIENNIAEKIFMFEKKIASLLFENEKKRDFDCIYNSINFNDLQELLGKNINLNCIFFWIKKLKPNIDDYFSKIISFNFYYFKELGKIFEEFGIDFIKLYLKYNIFVKSSEILSDDIYDLYFNFFDKILTGTKIKKSDLQRNISILSNNLGEIIGQKYIKEYYNPKTTSLILDLINKIKKSSCEIISKSSWMNSVTKKKAINKINKMKTLIGYSEISKDYKPIIDANIDSLNLFDALKVFSIYYFKYNINKLDKKLDHREWHMNVYETNAYYNPLNNQIVFPAGILQNPLFSPDASFEKNLGGIGSVIAHEISHGFDDQGRKFDFDGNLKTWWLKSDIDNYKKKVKPIIDQFNSIKLFDINISGQMTLGENIADYTGITIITNILNKLNVDKSLYKNMYKSYANVFKQKIRQNELIKRLYTDVHSPGRFRINQILSNIPEFISVYNIKPGHKMFIEEKNRINLWN